MSADTNYLTSRTKNVRHGHVFSPPSRAYFAWQAGLLDQGALNQREAGKFFPHSQAGLSDSVAADDMPNATPPPDGKIASANQATGAMLDEAGEQWQKHAVQAGQILDVSWYFTASHVTRRWNYFITKAEWDPNKKLSRAQFEAEPFYSVQINLQPFWAHTGAMKPANPTIHKVPLPERKGYHVLLAIWEVADTGNAFYQVVDLDFVDRPDSEERPATPTGLAAVRVTDKSIELRWDKLPNASALACYRITRNGSTTVDIDSTEINWIDNSVSPSSVYTYFISAVSADGQVSPPSRTISVSTAAEGEDGAPPSAPLHLHSMGETAESVSLMWGASTGPTEIVKYVIFRDGREIGRVHQEVTDYVDVGLRPNTTYRYYVAAVDQADRWSVPSNVLEVKTQLNVEPSPHRQWRLGEKYERNELVTHGGCSWRCIQAHISYSEDWAPGLSGSISLWAAA